MTGYAGRLAPSPTGFLHLGHVRTFAVARDRARRGVLRLRIDDLDRARAREEYVTAAIEDLHRLGIAWQGEPIFQSRRAELYGHAWARLVRLGLVYPCMCSRKDLADIAGAPHEVGGEVLYPGTCRPAFIRKEQAERWACEGPDGRNWRFRVSSAPICWQDGGAGAQEFTVGRDFGDFGVWRRDGLAAYQLASVVDDAAMGVTEVVRGADLLLSTARQILLFRALGAAVPAFYHVPLVLDADGQRLAKRTDALSVRALWAQGLSAAEVLRMAGAESSTSRVCQARP